MAQLQAVPPQGAAQEVTIAGMVQQAHKGVYDLQERMLNLAGRTGVMNSPVENCAGAPTPNQMRDLAQDLLKLVAACHEAMSALDRIA